MCRAWPILWLLRSFAAQCYHVNLKPVLSFIVQVALLFFAQDLSGRIERRCTNQLWPWGCIFALSGPPGFHPVTRPADRIRCSVCRQSSAFRTTAPHHGFRVVMMVLAALFCHVHLVPSSPSFAPRSSLLVLFLCPRHGSCHRHPRACFARLASPSHSRLHAYRTFVCQFSRCIWFQPSCARLCPSDRF